MLVGPSKSYSEGYKAGEFLRFKKRFLNGLRSGIIALGLKEIPEEEWYVRALQMGTDQAAKGSS